MVESITRGEKMKDFPMFTTEFGIASLILREIPYRGEAFILIQDTQQPENVFPFAGYAARRKSMPAAMKL